MTMWWLKRKTLNREILEQRVIVIAKLLLFSPGLWFKMAPSITIKWFYLLRSQSVVESQGCQILTDHRLNTRSDMRISNSSETPASILGYLQRRGTLLPKATDFFFFFLSSDGSNSLFHLMCYFLSLQLFLIYYLQKSIIQTTQQFVRWNSIKVCKAQR